MLFLDFFSSQYQCSNHISNAFPSNFLFPSVCPNIRKLNLVIHYKSTIVDGTTESPIYLLGSDEEDSELGSHLPPPPPSLWACLDRLEHLVELDLITMRFDNVRRLLKVVGKKIRSADLGLLKTS